MPNSARCSCRVNDLVRPLVLWFAQRMCEWHGWATSAGVRTVWS